MSLIFKGCSHKDADFLIIYKPNPKLNNEKINESTELLCKSCLEDPNLVNPLHILHVYNFKTGEQLR